MHAWCSHCAGYGLARVFPFFTVIEFEKLFRVMPIVRGMDYIRGSLSLSLSLSHSL